MKKVTLFCVAALFSLLSFAQNDKGDIVKTGDKMPAFTLTSTVNGTVKYSLISLPLGAVLARVNWQKFRKPFGPNIKTTRISA